MTVLEPDITVAAHFLSLLDPTAKEFTFQIVDDRKTGPKRKNLTRLIHASLDECEAELVALNKQGAGVYVTVNRTDLQGRSLANMTAIRAIIQDDDDGVFQGQYPVAPHIEVTTSPGKSQRYWLTESDELGEFGAVQQRLVVDYGSDPNATDLSRVLRVPGFYHLKDPAQPFKVKIESVSGAARLSWADVKKSFPPVNTMVATARMPDPDAITIFLDADQLRDLEDALKFIPMDNRAEWINIGIALKSVANPDATRPLWEAASRKSDKWDEDSDASWDTFEPNGSITYRSVFATATQYGWRNPGKRIDTGTLLAHMGAVNLNDPKIYNNVLQIIGRNEFTRHEKNQFSKLIKKQTGTGKRDFRADLKAVRDIDDVGDDSELSQKNLPT